MLPHVLKNIFTSLFLIKLVYLKSLFRLFKRMADYYKDTHYDFLEIGSLINEISRIKKLFSKDIIVQEQLTKIEVACVKAMENKLSIWVFCD